MSTIYTDPGGFGVNDIERLALDLIGEDADNPDVFTEGSEQFQLLRGSVNDGVQEIASSLGTVERIYYLNLIDGRNVYRLSSLGDTFGYVIEIMDRARHVRLEQTDIRSLARHEPQWQKFNGYPTHYIHVGHDTILLYRKPQASGTVLEVRYAAVPASYGEGSGPVRLREQFQRAAAYYAVSEYYASRGAAERATEAYEEYLETAGLEFKQPARGDEHYTMGRQFAYRR